MKRRVVVLMIRKSVSRELVMVENEDPVVVKRRTEPRQKNVSLILESHINCRIVYT